MSTTIGIFVILSAIAAAVYWFVLRDRDYKPIWRALSSECGIPKEFAGFRFKLRTPQGCPVISTANVPANALRNLEIGVENQLRRHDRKYPYWPFKKQLDDYAFVFIDPMARNEVTEPGSPAIRASGIQTAGTCIGLNPFRATKRDYIVLPHQEAEDWRFNDYLMRSAWHESEHVREAYNDRTVFQRYAVEGDVHPHVDFPDMPVTPAV